ncbi:hypothetical protein TL16_g06781 [Triparma laevis f. inornata]|uniref:Uncharacterized protein n=1 Tax=Triparma laevis f. inornata TaxID=1714386 RepID=A0A9W7AUT1_9STRA|nr:hypothetical protein TL16_g06781 [Triparma laevis f. inornata]
MTRYGVASKNVMKKLWVGASPSQVDFLRLFMIKLGLLREKREEVNKHILKEEEEKAKIQKDLSILTDRLSQINESLARKAQARNEYDKTIQETEAAYMKILESSQTLLHVLKRETVNLTKKKQSSS